MIKSIILSLNLIIGFTFVSYAQEDTSTINLNNEELFKEYFNKGMEANNRADFDVAIANFEQALIYKPGDAETTEMIKICKDRKQEQQNLIEAEKRKILEMADKMYNEGNYKDALKYYTRYKKLKPDDISVDEKIKRCDDKLK